MHLHDPETVSRLLDELREGRAGAIDRLMPLVYGELRDVAHRELMRRRPGDTLDTSALVHETYVKVVGSKRTAWNDRGHFLAVCATAMRHIIVDYALKQRSLKRGGGQQRVTLDDSRLAPEEQAREILALHEALDRLALLNERLARVVECRFFGGLSVPETAEALMCSPRTVDREWQKAKAWLYREIRSD
jgi:RNA polymerase sigma factor (TIGR02999 family)